MTGDELREIRESLKMSRDDFAKCLGVEGNRAVYRWESEDTPVPKRVEILTCILRDIPGVIEYIDKQFCQNTIRYINFV